MIPETEKRILRITIDRTEVHNAFNEVLISELRDAFFNEYKKNPNCRVIVLSGTGTSFSAGADLNWMKKMVAFKFKTYDLMRNTLGQLHSSRK